MDWLRRHLAAFWKSGPENLYTYIWWAIYAGGSGLLLWAASWILPRILSLEPAVVAFLAMWGQRVLIASLTLAVLALAAALMSRMSQGASSGAAHPAATTGGTFWDVPLQRPRLNLYISTVVVDASYAYVGLRLSNLGAPTSINGWEINYERGDGSVVVLSEHFLIDSIPQLFVPREMHGQNLVRDYSMIATNETRPGWVAFAAPKGDEVRALLRTLKVRCRDVAGNVTEPSLMPWPQS